MTKRLVTALFVLTLAGCMEAPVLTSSADACNTGPGQVGDISPEGC
ncbi:hypothetical protein [Actibacterium mucosum]|nr:hypothetical protein [Actibacterium mucosum]